MDFAILSLFAAVTLVPAVLMFLQRKLVNAVICLAAAAVGSSLLLLYVSQTLAALLQIFVFVGGLSTYLVIAVGSEEKQAQMLGRVKFFVAAAAMLAGLSLMLGGIDSSLQPTGNSLVSSAAVAFQDQYAFLYAAVFLVFATATGSVLVMKRFTRRVI